MKTTLPVLLLLSALFLSGCDYIYGVSRGSNVRSLPDLPKVKARIESYPEVKEVKFWQAAGGRPITLTGLKKAEEVFYLSYTDRQNVHGTLMFTRNYKGEVSYSQYLIDINRRPPQPWIDATWPIMKKIEKDLEDGFGYPEIRATLKTNIHGVEDPERMKPNSESCVTRSGHMTPFGSQNSNLNLGMWSCL